MMQINAKDTEMTQAAQLLWSTWQSNGRIEQLPVAIRPMTRAQGYQVQAEVARLAGQAVMGWKIAATSEAGQKHIGVDGPQAGRMLAQRAFDSGAVVPLTGNGMLVAEAEFAFKMGRDLPPRTTPYTQDEVLAAVASLHPSIEIPDSRYRDYATVGEAQLIADNACACYYVLGAATKFDWRTLDLSRHAVSASVNGQIKGQGTGAAVLGDPRIALAWMVNEISRIGETLHAGQVVTTGTCVVPLPIQPGDQVEVDFGVLGGASARFTA
jgi:2-keto-4-pentenoate hydratase